MSSDGSDTLSNPAGTTQNTRQDVTDGEESSNTPLLVGLSFLLVLGLLICEYGLPFF